MLTSKRTLLALAFAGLAAPAMVSADTASTLLDQPSYNQERDSSSTTGSTGTSSGTVGQAIGGSTIRDPHRDLSTERDQGMGDASDRGTSGAGTATQHSDEMRTDDVPSSPHQREAVDDTERGRDGMGAPAMDGTRGADQGDSWQGDLQTGPGAPQSGEFEQRGSESPETMRRHDTPGTNPGAYDN